VATAADDRAIRIAVLSDRRLFRDALAACLGAQSEYEVVGHAADLDDLLQLCELRRPDVVLVDVGPGLGGGRDCGGRDGGGGGPGIRDGFEKLSECVARARVVVVYERLTPAELAALWRLGVDTLVPCSHGLDALLVVLARYLDDDRAQGAAEDGLTQREREIIKLVSAGHTVDRIADLLEISTSAVANAKRRIYHKLEVASQSQAVARAAALGIVARQAAPVTVNGNGRGGVVAVLRGTEGTARQQVAAALLAGGIPFATEVAPGRTEPADFEKQGHVLMVLVDPAPDDWPDGRHAGLPVALVRSEPPRRAEVLEALLRGAVAVVTVDRVAVDLVPALTLATHGYLAVEADALLDAVRGPNRMPVQGLPELTSRECDILRSIAEGHTVRQTARVLGIAEKTVENTQARLFRKLGARNRAGALAAAHALGLLELVRNSIVTPETIGMPRGKVMERA
jgi:two-component system nitrate/nitrite response regulator NarL